MSQTVKGLRFHPNCKTVGLINAGRKHYGHCPEKKNCLLLSAIAISLVTLFVLVLRVQIPKWKDIEPR